MKNKVIVIDSIMGSGKTSAIIQMIKSNPQENYICIVPYLDEVKRFKESTGFKEPELYNESKIDNFHTLLKSGKDIVSTHALFLNTTDETIELIKDNGYTLILDESLDVFKSYNDIVKNFNGKTVNNDTVQWLLEQNHISIDEKFAVSWNSTTSSDFQFSEIAKMAKDKTLFCIDKSLFWVFNPKIFKAFEAVYILTYQHEGTLFDSYMKMNNIDYTTKSIIKENGGEYNICGYSKHLDNVKRIELSKLINIYEGYFNNIGTKKNSLSINNLKSKSKNDIQEIITCMRRYKRKFSESNLGLMWTTSKQDNFYLKFNKKGFKYTQVLAVHEDNLSQKELKKLLCFVPCNAKGTNDYKERTTLLYILNRYLNPEIKKYFHNMGYPINDDVFALNELIQWVFRSAVREGKEINLYLPSSRMRNLLYEWLMCTPPSTKVLEKRLC